MKRKAILVESSNVKGQTDLPGARADVQNWKEFLLSDLGGAWEETEIKILPKPYSGDLEAELNVAADCYCFLAFSGHGRAGSIVLNDHWDAYPITKLIPKCEKATLIVDACRGIEDAERLRLASPLLAKNAAFANESAIRASHSARGWIVESASTQLSAPSFHLNAYLLNWRLALLTSDKGILQMLACSKGQGAGENPKAGGYYTSLLIQSAIKWNKTYTSSKVHSTKEAHDYAANLLPPQQTPEYQPASLAFPFAAKK